MARLIGTCQGLNSAHSPRIVTSIRSGNRPITGSDSILMQLPTPLDCIRRTLRCPPSQAPTADRDPLLLGREHVRDNLRIGRKQLDQRAMPSIGYVGHLMHIRGFQNAINIRRPLAIRLRISSQGLFWRSARPNLPMLSLARSCFVLIALQPLFVNSYNGIVNPPEAKLLAAVAQRLQRRRILRRPRSVRQDAPSCQQPYPSPRAQPCSCRAHRSYNIDCFWHRG